MFIDPIKIIDELNLSEHEIVIDLGAGSGIYSLEIARRLLKSGGVVYAVDIQQNVLTRLAHAAKDEKLKNLHFIHADIEKIGGVQLKSNTSSLTLISNVLFTSQMKKEILEEASRLTCEGGSLLIIDWKESSRKFGPSKENIFNENDCIKLAMECGFSLDRFLTSGPHHFAMLLHRNIDSKY